MKKHLFLLMTLLALASPAQAQSSTLPKIITDGFSAYGQSGISKAVDVWLAGSATGSSTNKTNFVNYITGIENNSGKFESYDYVGSVTFSPTDKLYYFVFHYDKAPVYGMFEVYTQGGNDMIINYNTNATSTSVFPVSFWAKDKTKS